MCCDAFHTKPYNCVVKLLELYEFLVKLLTK